MPNQEQNRDYNPRREDYGRGREDYGRGREDYNPRREDSTKGNTGITFGEVAGRLLGANLGGLAGAAGGGIAGGALGGALVGVPLALATRSPNMVGVAGLVGGAAGAGLGSIGGTIYGATDGYNNAVNPKEKSAQYREDLEKAAFDAGAAAVLYRAGLIKAAAARPVLEQVGAVLRGGKNLAKTVAKGEGDLKWATRAGKEHLAKNKRGAGALAAGAAGAAGLAGGAGYAASKTTTDDE